MARTTAGRWRASCAARAARRRPPTTSSTSASGADSLTGPGTAAGDTPRVFASLGSRFLEILLDLVVITIPSLIVSRLLEDAPGRAGDAVVTILVSLYFIVSYTAAGNGYSIGKFVLGIRVVDAHGEPLSLAAAALRGFMSIGI